MKFSVTPQNVPDVLLIEPQVFEDDRGYFKESYQQDALDSVLSAVRFVQDNESLSAKGVVRGLHFQHAPYEQAKLVRVVQGSIWDVAVDIRPDSATYKQFVAVELSAGNHLQLFLPRGFAHGFLVLSDSAIVQYKTDQFYQPEADAGIHPFDPDLNIPWPMNQKECLLSSKDQSLPSLSEIEH